MDLVTKQTPGTLLSVTGGVIAFGTCDAIAAAELDFWQANTDGDYDNVGFELRGVMTADAGGLWELQTIAPGNYLDGGEMRPAAFSTLAA